MMNLTTNRDDTDRFADNADLRRYYRGFGLDGVELMQAGEDTRGVVREQDVVGVHLKYFPEWVRLWLGDERAMLEEYGSLEVCRRFFGGTDREALLRAFRENLEIALRYCPAYAVFHVANCGLAESVHRRYRYDDRQVADAAIQLLNLLLDGVEERFELLLENLWSPGMTLLQPEITYRLLDGIAYGRKGIMLDTGHLLHTNTALRTQEEGVAYVHSILDRYGDMGIFRGVHLHQALSGAYVEQTLRHPFALPDDYFQRLSVILPHIFHIDAHRPFVCDSLSGLLERIAPAYLVSELITENREAHAACLERQMACLGEIRRPSAVK